MASNVYDAIIIGGGHNGLTAGAYFAREGARTIVLEARNKTGGAADTSAPFADHPEINVTTYSYVMSLMPPTIIRELKLKQFIISETFDDGFPLRLMAKDVRTADDMAHALGIATPLADLCAGLWDAAARELDEKANHTEMIRYIRRLPGS